jgi:hypothetical protein
MRGRRRLRGRAIALFATAALVLAACPEDDADEPGVDETPETESIEEIRDAAANTLDQGTATTTITLAAADEAGQDDAPNGADDQDDPAENGAADTGDVDANGELSLQTEEDFDQNQRRITTEAGLTGEAGETDAEADDVEFIVDGWEVYFPLDDDAAAETDDADGAGDDADGADDDADGADDDADGADDDADGADDEAATDEDRTWGVFDLQDLIGDETDNGAEDDAEDDAAEDDAADDDADATNGTQTATVPVDDELRIFPFADSHMILEVLADVEGDVTGGADDNGAATGTGYTVRVDVTETADAIDDDTATWLEWVAGERTQLDVQVWLSEDEDEATIERVEYHAGVEEDPAGIDEEEAPEDDPAADDADTANGADDDLNGEGADQDGAADDQDAPGDDDAVNGAPADDEEAGNDAADDDDAETTPEGPEEGAEEAGDDPTAEGDVEAPATDERGGVVVSIEYTDLGGEVEIEVPTDAEEVTETELREALPELPTPAEADGPAADGAETDADADADGDDAGPDADADGAGDADEEDAA